MILITPVVELFLVENNIKTQFVMEVVILEFRLFGFYMNEYYNDRLMFIKFLENFIGMSCYKTSVNNSLSL